jgi:hypothetical protein
MNLHEVIAGLFESLQRFIANGARTLVTTDDANDLFLRGWHADYECARLNYGYSVIKITEACGPHTPSTQEKSLRIRFSNLQSASFQRRAYNTHQFVAAYNPIERAPSSHRRRRPYESSIHDGSHRSNQRLWDSC